MNILRSFWTMTAAGALTAGVWTGQCAEPLQPFVSENDAEFFTQGDFDGDGRLDVAIVDRDTGRVRIGYQLTAGTFTWPNYKITKTKDVTGIAVGRLFDSNKDAFALSAADANLVHLIAAGGPGVVPQPVVVPPPGLGPNSVIAVDIGGAGNTPLHDVAVSTIYDTPDPNKLSLFRNDAGKVTKLGEGATVPGAVTRANRLALKTGGAEVACAIIAGDEKVSFRVDTFSSGQAQTVAAISEIEADVDYLVGTFRGSALRDFVFFKKGEKGIHVMPVEEAGGKFQFGAGTKFELDEPIKFLAAVRQGDRDVLVVVYGEGKTGAVLSFDGSKAPTTVLPLLAPESGEMLSGLIAADKGFMLVAAPAEGKIKYSTRYEVYDLSDSTFVKGIKGPLPSLADTDDSTVPDIHKMIVANLKEKTAAEMKPYTNTIPGTDVPYVMVPIAGGEFLMGSPENEEGRKADEGPQRKVKVEPFWMGAYEVTWNEYSLFMYPDEEQKARESIKSDPQVDKISDAVTRPSKPYVEMSFGMGKDGYPAIAMSQHAARKYCHWLSAKTGHFYRLPTEAEWEYACRAGTTTAYSFGDDPSKLPQHAWLDENSDFKYQKVGKKKPNPWGLFDMHGNVVEYCLDEYDAGFYGKPDSGMMPMNWPKKRYGKVVRGGSWDWPAVTARSAARHASEPGWNAQDPQLPKSVWWLSDAQIVGFRIVRPLKVPTTQELLKLWPNGPEEN